MRLTRTGLALREWSRRPVRTAVTVAAIAIAVASLLSLLGFERGYRASLEHELDRLGAQILVVPKGCPFDAASLALHGANWPCHLRAAYHAEVAAIPGIAAAVPVLMQAVTGSRGEPVVYLGTDQRILALRPGWKLDGRFPSQPGEILVGARLAERQGWKLHQTVELPGLPRASAAIAGILQRTGEADDHFIHLPLGEAQRLFHRTNQLTHILVRLQDPTRLDDVVGRLRGCDAGMNLNVVPVAHLFRSLQELVRGTRWLLACVVGVAILIAASGVTNALLMSVAERTRDLGILRAIGASPGDVFVLVQLEAIALGIAGGALGLLAALASAHSLDTWLHSHLPFSPGGSLVAWDTPVILASLAGAVLLACIAASLPAWRACHVDPRRAMQGIR